MKFATLYGMVIASGLLIGALARVPNQRDIPWLVYANLVTQFLAGCCAAWLLHKPADRHSKLWASVYLIALLLSLLSAFPLAWKLTAMYPAWMQAGFFLGGFFVAALTFMAVGYHGATNIGLLFQGYVLTALGFAASFGLLASLDRIPWLLTAGFSALWWGLGAASFATALGGVRHPEQWREVGLILPGTVGLVIFGLMFLSLAFGQAEGARLLDAESERSVRPQAVEAAAQRSNGQ